MTDTLHAMHDANALPLKRQAEADVQSGPSWRTIVGAALILAIAAAALSASPAQVAQARQAADPELAMLLQFMALVKAAMSLAAIGIVMWRLGYPVRATYGLVYTVAVAMLAASPVLIFQMAHVALGAVLFHAGIVVLLAAAWVDRDGVSGIARNAVEGLRARRA